MSATAGTILRVEGLRTHFATRRGTIKAVDGLSFGLEAGKTLCIVGESGSGKTVSSLSIMRLVDLPGRIVEGRVMYRDTDLLALDEAAMERIRGDRIGMVFQDPMTSLNPAFRVGDQIAEGMLIHQQIDKAEARERTLELLLKVGIPQPEARYDDYPHQFSGGMRQRVLIASAIACRPDILIADEPTTALDVTIQAQILKLLKDVQRDLNSAMILVTHDLGVVAAMADDVMVMYAGRMIEYADVETIFKRPRHPYTQGLLDSVIRLEDTRDVALTPIPGVPPDLSQLPAGCSFAPRCPAATGVCSERYPALHGRQGKHQVACHLVSDLDTAAQEATS
jgi:peptide/nickel transport system ATP-binding protein